jgi:hypothetical protein
MSLIFSSTKKKEIVEYISALTESTIKWGNIVTFLTFNELFLNTVIHEGDPMFLIFLELSKFGV